MSSKVHLLIVILASICITNSLYFPLNIWKDYDLNSPYLCFSHSEQAHRLCLL
jgi:hypothetical protein